MSRTHFWTILLGTDPTSFRARDKETLVPTLKQLQRRNPEAVIKWFEGGRLFETPLEAEEERLRLEREKRPKAWRPGGEHKDPRAKYEVSRDQKRHRFKLRQQHARSQDESSSPGAGTPARPDRSSKGGYDPGRRDAGGSGGSAPAGRPPRPGGSGSGSRPPRNPRGPGQAPGGGSSFRPKSGARPAASRPAAQNRGAVRPPRPRGPKKSGQE